MKLLFLILGTLLQGLALYVAFYLEADWNIYLATMISAFGLCTLVGVRSLIAPACLMAGIMIGLSLSHNEVDVQLLHQMEQTAQAYSDDKISLSEISAYFDKIAYSRLSVQNEVN
ncbi:hypothetical protein A3K86_02340 [Photobacterium jeanii]|uniref:Uncharacterized protein n=1 Tax=Photobacterium jeanii TaxID=858640 RepID=A0A178KK85_9GAMM|nr:hypothetical protein [Photobacterium jeanii]OAN17778.1 hypothetical protein A3K86_02340 [Photobacterium jeanii]PST92556.1 hypothetical protein C9I91_05130 [Photobacterium jeanii]